MTRRVPILLVFGGLLVAGLVVDRTRPAPAEVTFGTAYSAGATRRQPAVRRDDDVVLPRDAGTAGRLHGGLRDDVQPHRQGRHRDAHRGAK